MIFFLQFLIYSMPYILRSNILFIKRLCRSSSDGREKNIFCTRAFVEAEKESPLAFRKLPHTILTHSRVVCVRKRTFQSGDFRFFLTKDAMHTPKKLQPNYFHLWQWFFIFWLISKFFDIFKCTDMGTLILTHSRYYESPDYVFHVCILTHHVDFV